MNQQVPAPLIHVVDDDDRSRRGNRAHAATFLLGGDRTRGKTLRTFQIRPVAMLVELSNIIDLIAATTVPLLLVVLLASVLDIHLKDIMDVLR